MTVFNPGIFMNLSQQTLLDLLEDLNINKSKIHFYSLTKDDPGFLSSIQMSLLYTDSALLITIMGFLKEQLWLKNQEDKELDVVTSYEEFITPLFCKELLPIYFLKSFLIKNGKRNIKKIIQDTQLIEKKVLSLMIDRPSEDQKDFVIESLNEMTKKFIAEEKDQDGRDHSLGHLGLELYRTFDHLDDMFDLDYKLDRDMVVDHKEKERLYERAGVGVQSGYSTILLALNPLNAENGCKIIDLGSGYGRVGLVCALLRPDIDFTGYEFVPHRVEISNNACDSLGLQENLNFEVQDLSLESFKVPKADIYYLYDPFTKETYSYVLNQIVEMSKCMKVTVVTKGNGRAWLVDIAKENSWPDPIFIDEGNLCIFKSR